MDSIRKITRGIYAIRTFEIIIGLMILAVLFLILFLNFQASDYYGHASGAIKLKLRFLMGQF